MLISGIIGIILSLLYIALTPACESSLSLKEEKKIIATKKNCKSNIILFGFLLTFEAWACGIINQAYLSYFYSKKFSLSFQSIGFLLFWCYLAVHLSAFIA